MGEMRAALYMDFDNFFSGLFAADPRSALELVASPARWLSRLTYSHGVEGGRRWLALRCYLNPSGWLIDPRDGERVYMSRFRPYFVQAGFEVIDCPTLARGNNAADIRIVIDALEVLRGEARLDELVLASSDSDFTPLLQVFRAHDRQITMIATGETAAAYEAVADQVLGAQEVLDLLQDEPDCSGLADDADEPTISEGRAELREAFRAEMTGLYRSATEPINLARAATQIAGKLGSEIRASNWLGTGSFVRAVRALSLPNAAFSQHHLWDTSRHAPPDQKHPHDEFPALVATMCEVTGLPRIPRDDWPRIYGNLEEYGQSHEFNLTEASRWPRDKAADEGHQIGRAVFVYVLSACARNGARFDVVPRPTATQIGAALLTSVRTGAETVGVELTEDDVQVLRDWLSVSAS